MRRSLGSSQKEMTPDHTKYAPNASSSIKIHDANATWTAASGDHLVTALSGVENIYKNTRVPSEKTILTEVRHIQTTLNSPEIRKTKIKIYRQPRTSRP